MTKRGLQVGAQGRYLFDSFQGEAHGRVSVQRPRHRNHALRAGVQAHAKPRLRARAHRLLEPQQGLRQHLFRRPVGQRGADFANDAAARRRFHLGGRTLAADRARAGLPDAAGSRRAATVALQSGAGVLLARLEEVDWNGLTFAGVAEYADFRQPTLTTGQRMYARPNRAGAQGEHGPSARRLASICGTTISTRSDPAFPTRSTTQSPSRPSMAGCCSSATGMSWVGTSCRRSSRARSTSTCPTATRRARRCSTRRSTRNSTSPQSSLSRTNPIAPIGLLPP